MTNFAFLPNQFRSIADSAIRAEGHIIGDPRAACFHARFTLEAIVHWLYRYDRTAAHALRQQPQCPNSRAILSKPCPPSSFLQSQTDQKHRQQSRS